VTDGELRVVVGGLGGEVTVAGDGRRLVWTEHRDSRGYRVTGTPAHPALTALTPR
jgi:hypothetical protein